MIPYSPTLGETIFDVCYNANGSLYAIDDNLSLNNIDTYTPDLSTDPIYVSETIYDNDAVLSGAQFRFNSATVSNINELVAEIVNILNV